MYEMLSFLSGVILAVMIQINGGLSGQFGAYHAALYIHIVGSVFAALLLLLRRQRVSGIKGLPFWMFLGGVIGVLTTVFHNIVFSHISLTSIMALDLFGQLVLSYSIDRFGWFGMERRKEDLSIPCVLLSVVGIALMLDNSASGGLGYILLALGAGFSNVLSRTVNAHLSNHIGALQGSLINHLTGLPVCLLLALMIPEQTVDQPFRLWIWCGGILGVLIVMICNITVPKIPACRLTLFTLCGQLFCGILLDVLLGGELNTKEFGAGLLVAAGILSNQLLKIHRKKQVDREEAYRARIARIEQEHRDAILKKAQAK